MFYGHLLLWVDESLHGNHVSWHIAFVWLLLLGVVPNPINVVGLFEGFHLKVRNLGCFRWSVGWGVSNFGFHTGCVNVLECARCKPSWKGRVLRLFKAVVKQRLILRAQLLHGNKGTLWLNVGVPLCSIHVGIYCSPLMLGHTPSCRHDHRLLLLDQLSVLAMPSSTSDYWRWDRGKLPLLALTIRILSSGRRSSATRTHHVPEALAVFRLQQDEEDGVKQHGDVDHAVESHLGFNGWTHRHASVHVSPVAELAAVHLHKLVDVMWSSAEKEKAQEENHEKGGPTVGRIQSRGTRSTELHQNGN